MGKSALELGKKKSIMGGTAAELLLRGGVVLVGGAGRAGQTGLSDVGLSVAGWPDGAGQACTR